MLWGQILTPGEGPRYAQEYDVPTERFRLIPWALSRSGAPADPADGLGVVSSGRAQCDWDTLFAAAELGAWPLTVICSDHDFPRVRSLNVDGRATVHCELDRASHDLLLRQSALYALCLEPTGPSSGHVRLMAAVDAGVPVVATDVPGLEGYVEWGATAARVPPRDARALAEEIERLLGAPAERRALALAAGAKARDRTYADLFGELRSELVR